MSLRAMFSSISGLQADSQWLDVIGNNISNTNTVGYKASRAEFSDQFSQALSEGAGDNPVMGVGGTDAQQIGLGTRLASIETIFTEGVTLNTGVSTDISIQGDGFLVAKEGSQTLLTRAGDLTFDSDGYLVNPQGDRIQGQNALVQFNRDPINTVSNIPNQPLIVNETELAVNSNNIADLTPIQIDPRMTLPPKATTEVTFKGNLDSLQQPNVLDLLPNIFTAPPPQWKPALPVGLTIADLGPVNALDTARMTAVPNATGGFTLQQVSNLSTFNLGIFPPPQPLENGFINLGAVQNYAGSYVWDQKPPVPPAQQVTEMVYDSLGNPRQITVQFYQVNDIGSDGINNPNGPNQVCFAWYAFDTTGGKTISTANLLGGTGIGEGDPFYDHNLQGQNFFGDFLWFNTDGSLASSGGVGGFFGPPGLNFNYMVMPHVYLPPTDPNLVSPIPDQGAEIDPIALNFGDFGLLGGQPVLPIGTRDGMYSDAEGNYQTVDGVNTYVPKNTVYAASQDGYQAGNLQGLNINPEGFVQGAFTNGQTVNLAQIALAQVQNPEGLAMTGNNDYALAPNSGPMHVGLAGTGDFGTIQGGSLEGSNVDLTVELSNMIVAQRGFDTNSRMLAVVNETMDVTDHLGEGG